MVQSNNESRMCKSNVTEGCNQRITPPGKGLSSISTCNARITGALISFKTIALFQDHLSVNIFQDHLSVDFFQDHLVLSRPFINGVISRPLISLLLSRPLLLSGPFGSFQTIHQLASFKTIGFFQDHLSVDIFPRPFIN